MRGCLGGAGLKYWSYSFSSSYFTMLLLLNFPLEVLALFYFGPK